MSKIAILIPCFNESSTIAKVIKDYQKALPEATIYVYDNNSTDDTAEIAKKAGAIVKFESRQGKGNVIRTMFRNIDADCYLLVDGDDTYPPTHAREMVNSVLKKGSDMVIGDRLSSTYFQENKRAFHGLGNRFVRFSINHLYGANIQDIMTGCRAFSRQFIKTFPVLSKGFEVETEMTMHALDKNLLIANVPIDYRDRPAGSQSKLHTVPDGLRVIRTIITLFKVYKPLAFFSLIAILSILIGIALLIPVLVDYFSTGLVPKIPTFITSLAFFVIALLSFYCGLILDNIARANRQDFELKLNEFKMEEQK